MSRSDVSSADVLSAAAMFVIWPRQYFSTCSCNCSSHAGAWPTCSTSTCESPGRAGGSPMLQTPLLARGVPGPGRRETNQCLPDLRVVHLGRDVVGPGDADRRADLVEQRVHVGHGLVPLRLVLVVGDAVVAFPLHLLQLLAQCVELGVDLLRDGLDGRRRILHAPVVCGKSSHRNTSRAISG